ncbi:MAG TPA: helix-turn-helix transcriptional regulator [Candidatus Sulfomarinibacteraceae bacterium]|nr:helix-turn-helix transcriptional regulator [Candidatus Sulfomarinibacteraceae bacterium]
MDVKEHLPLPETTFLILLSLARAPRHGYAIMQDVAELSDGRLQMSTGTLYGGLRRMLEQGWIERFDEKSKVVDGRARKAYRLTELGRKILNADAARMQSLLQAVRQGNAI